MRKSIKRLLVLVAVVVLCFATAMLANAASSGKEEYFSYTIESGKATITDVDKSIGANVVIPDTLGGYPVTYISYKAFTGIEELVESVILPDSVVSIDSAFEDCSNLKSITLPDSLMEIGSGAFENCESLESIIIPDSVTSIGSSAFRFCESLESIIIPDSVTFIGMYAFDACTNLKKITVDENNAFFSSDSYGALFNKDKTNLIKYSVASERTSYKIPEGVISIGESAFYECSNLEKVQFPESLTEICDYAFMGCDTLVKIVIPDNVTDIGSMSFFACVSVSDVILGESVNSIGYQAFGFCNSMVSITIPASMKKMDQKAFPESVSIYYRGTEKQWNAIEIIDVAGNPIVDPIPIVATIHYCEKVEVAAKCTKAGSIKYACSECSDSIVIKTTSALGHSFTNYKKDNNATCTADGTKTAKCDRCTVTKTVSDTGSALGHNMGAYVVTIKPTATTEGVERSDCSRCDYYVTRAVPVQDDIYNIGEETYRFNNFGDSDSAGGHCFGMSVTSSGYYIGSLDKSIIGGNEDTDLYSFNLTAKVKAPICYYHKIQGPGPEQKSMVAGGSIDLRGIVNTLSDWNSCVNYVKSHKYDNKGSLQIGMWYRGGGGHAVNFLYYANVNGQDRIYAYDNNYPTKETYYYMGSDGYIRQYVPGYIINTSIMGMDLMDVYTYYSLANEFKSSSYIYADKDEIIVENATMYDLKCSEESEINVMFEIPEGSTMVKIIPLVDNAEFEYLQDTYSFGGINEETYGKLNLTKSGENAFVIVAGDDCTCNCHKTGFAGFIWKILNFIYKLFRINQECICGKIHY